MRFRFVRPLSKDKIKSRSLDMSSKIKFGQKKVNRCCSKVSKRLGNVMFCTGKVQVMLFTFFEQSATLNL